MKIAISTDGNSGFTHAEAEKLGITIIPTPRYYRRRNLSGRYFPHTRFFLRKTDG